MPLENFLKLVLPNEGIKCWTSIPKTGFVKNHFCHSFDELAEQIRASDATGVDTYHACAVYATDKNRRAGNALGAQCFWMDVDVGEGKPYASQEAAIQALDQFCDRLSLPDPGLVRSGGGLHAYWTLDRFLMREEWLPVAGRLKLLAQTYGLLSNPSDLAIISDIARILRPPETHNYKLPGQPRLTSLDDSALFERLSCDEFIEQLLNSPLGDSIKNINNAERKPDAAPVNSTFSAGISRAFDASVGVKQGSRGATRLKYAGELVAKGFSAEEIMPKLLAWDALCQPPEGEAACLHSMKSAFNMHAAKHPAPPLPQVTIAEAPVALPALPNGWKFSLSGQLMIGVKNEAKELEWHVVSQQTVYLEAILNQEHHQNKKSYLFMQHQADKGWTHISMNSSEMEGPGWHAFWMERGGHIAPGMQKHFKTYVGRATDMWRSNAKDQTRYSQFGWKDGDKAFLVGSNLVHSDGRVTKAIGTDKLTPLMEIMKPSRNGSQALWTNAANKLGGLGLEAHLFMQVQSFVAPLMKFAVDEGNGGAIVSIVSEGSGKGKTPMTVAMASVWGEMGAVRTTGNNTGNRLIADIVQRCHLIQIQEEMTYNDPLLATGDVKRFTSGQDRGRLNQKGEPTGIPEVYQTLMVSVSNKSLYDIVRMADEPMSKRVFEIELDSIPKDVLDHIGNIAREMMANCGHVGLQFIRIITLPDVRQYIVDALQGNGAQVGHVQRKYRDLLQTDPEHRFIVWDVAATEVAARIIVHYGLMTFDVDRLMRWVVQQASRRIINKPVMAKENVTIGKFLREHLIDYCLTVQGPFIPGKGPCLPLKEPRKELGIRLEIASQRMYVAHDLVHPWCVKLGISFRNLTDKLLEADVIIERSRQVTLGAGTNYSTGRSVCWVLDMSHPEMSGIPVLANIIENAKEEVEKTGGLIK